MELTKSLKKEINEMDYISLLRRWRFAPAGDPIFQGISGRYFSKVMAKKREAIGNEEHVKISKELGW